jgi:PAS domain S-box-containing protein
MTPADASGTENGQRLDVLADAAAPAFVVDRDGQIVWSNAAFEALGGADALETGARVTVARIAASGAEGLARIRIGAAGRFEPLAFRSRRIVSDDLHGLLLEALETPGRAFPAASVAAPVQPAPPASEPAAEAAPPAQEPATVAHVDDDAPLDPRIGERLETAAGAARAPERSDPPIEAEQAEQPAPDDPSERLRFVFEIDGEGRLAFLSPDLGRAVGATAADAVGRQWSDVACELELDPEGTVAEALSSRSGWSELRVSWPLPNGARMPLTLSALPMFDRGRTFVGFRGFGRRDGDLIAPPPAAQPPEPEPEEAAASAAPPADPFNNVVPLRERAAAARPQTPRLSTVEEDAFDEIARRLRGAGVFAQRALRREGEADLVPLGEVPPPPIAPETAALAADLAPAEDWTLDDLGGRAPTASRVEDLLRLIDKLPVGALVICGGAIVYASRPALDIAGHDDVRSMAERGLAALFAEPLPRDDAAPASLRLIAQDGVEVEVEGRLATIAWRGAPATLLTLKRAEGATPSALAASAREEELAAILDTATDGVLTLDGAGRILTVNRSAEALLGYEARELVGGLFTLALAPESRRTAFDYLDGLKSNAVAALLNDGREVLGLVRQGGAIPLYMTLGRIGPPEDGRYCAVLRDITHWKKAEEELLAAKRQAERANAQKSDFLAKVSHEIRTPLNAIIGFAELMMEERLGPIGTARYKEYLRDIHLSGGHLISLVNDLLDLAKIESGRLDLDFSPVDVNEIVAQSAALLQPQANRGHVIIRTSLGRSLPPVIADRRSVRQIVVNLASNAVKFSRPGGQVILATALTDLGQVVIRVRDTGTGMSKNELAHALEPFRPLPATHGDGGAGIGLPLTKALVEANHAAFAIQSAPGEGTLVEVSFPASRVLTG